MTKKHVRRVQLKYLAADLTPADIASQCGITRQAVGQAISSKRIIYVEIDDSDVIVKVVEYKDPVEIWKI